MRYKGLLLLQIWPCKAMWKIPYLTFNAFFPPATKTKINKVVIENATPIRKIEWQSSNSANSPWVHLRYLFVLIFPTYQQHRVSHYNCTCWNWIFYTFFEENIFFNTNILIQIIYKWRHKRLLLSTCTDSLSCPGENITANLFKSPITSLSGNISNASVFFGSKYLWNIFISISQFEGSIFHQQNESYL